jgi:hypothetical protein
MSVVFILIVGYLFNDTSALYLFKPSIEDKKKEDKAKAKTAPVYTGLTPEETDIHKRLTEKLERTRKEEEVKVPIGQNLQTQITMAYSNVMGRF